jgi:hypothetical protein
MKIDLLGGDYPALQPSTIIGAEQWRKRASLC